MKRFLSTFLAVLLVLALSGCGERPSQLDDSSNSSANNDAEQPMKIALCLTGPANDGGWCQLAYDGLMTAKEQYGVEISYTENLQTTDMEAAVTDYAAQGYNLIFGLGFQFGDRKSVV